MSRAVFLPVEIVPADRLNQFPVNPQTAADPADVAYVRKSVDAHRARMNRLDRERWLQKALYRRSA